MSLAPNQYRVVLRTGFHNFYDDGQLLIIANYDYHFWYQTYDGRWANKHGDEEPEWLPNGTTPFSLGSSGWALNATGIDGTEYVHEDFYDGTINSYIITID